MAIHTCRKCGGRFERNTVGRPPAYCSECGGPSGSRKLTSGPTMPTTTNTPKPMTNPVEPVKVEEEMTVIDDLPNEMEEGMAECVVCGETYCDIHSPLDHTEGEEVRSIVKQGHQADTSDPAEMLKQALQALAPKAPEIDEAQVRAMVETAVGSAVGPVIEAAEQAVKVLSKQVEDVDAKIKQAIQDQGVTRFDIRVNDKAIDLPNVHHAKLPEVIQVMSQGIHVMLVGPAGSGKSTIVEQASKALGLDFYALSLEPTMAANKLFGYQDANGRYVTTPFRSAYDANGNGGVMLLDEMDNGHPGILAGLNQALSNRYCAFADGMVERHDKFVTAATANTFGRGPDRQYVGRNQLDAATLDRFAVIEILIDESMERTVAMGWATDESRDAVRTWIDYVQGVRQRIDENRLQIVCSPRTTIHGAKLLTAGMDWQTVADITLWKGISEDQKDRIK